MLFGLFCAGPPAILPTAATEGAPNPAELLKLPLLELGNSGLGGPADCHLIISVEIMGGLTGLLSRMRSSSSITAAERRGSSCRACKFWCSTSGFVALSKRQWTGSCFNVHAIDNCVGLQPSFLASNAISLILSAGVGPSSLGHPWKSKQLITVEVGRVHFPYLLISFVFCPRRVALTLFRKRSFGYGKSFCRLHDIHESTPSHQTHSNLVVQLRQVQLCLFAVGRD